MYSGLGNDERGLRTCMRECSNGRRTPGAGPTPQAVLHVQRQDPSGHAVVGQMGERTEHLTRRAKPTGWVCFHGPVDHARNLRIDVFADRPERRAMLREQGLGALARVFDFGEQSLACEQLPQNDPQTVQIAAHAMRPAEQHLRRQIARLAACASAAVRSGMRQRPSEAEVGKLRQVPTRQSRCCTGRCRDGSLDGACRPRSPCVPPRAPRARRGQSVGQLPEVATCVDRVAARAPKHLPPIRALERVRVDRSPSLRDARCSGAKDPPSRALRPETWRSVQGRSRCRQACV